MLVCLSVSDVLGTTALAVVMKLSEYIGNGHIFGPEMGENPDRFAKQAAKDS